MKLAVDVHYSRNSARAAGVAFEKWSDPAPLLTLTVSTPIMAEYVPGSLYLRELPPILSLIHKLRKDEGIWPEYIVIDGYVWLTSRRLPGLGLHLHQQLAQQPGPRPRVIGVAKNPYKDTPAPTLFRGGSKKPLFITAAGVNEQMAVAFIASMHGRSRIPDLLKLADSLSRQADHEERQEQSQ